MNISEIILIMSGYIYLLTNIILTIIRIILYCYKSTIGSHMLLIYFLKIISNIIGTIYALFFLYKIKYYIIIRHDYAWLRNLL